MTIDEARAFVGEEPCNITTLTEKDLYCEPPEEQPLPKRRQKRDTVNNLPEFIVGHIFLYFLPIQYRILIQKLVLKSKLDFLCSTRIPIPFAIIYFQQKYKETIAFLCLNLLQLRFTDFQIPNQQVHGNSEFWRMLIWARFL